MTDTLITKITGFLILASMAVEFAAIGITLRHGSGLEFAQIDFSTADQLVMLQQSRWAVTVFSLGILAPLLSMLVWPGMYQVLAPGGPSALPGTLVSSFGFLFGVLGEAIRLAVIIRLPPAYAAAADSARPAILATANTLGSLLEVLRYTSFVTTFAVGMPLIARAIILGRTVPPWLGWSLLVPSVLVGYIGAPLLVFGLQAGGSFLGVGLDVFFLWLLAVAVVLLRWRPPQSVAKVADDVHAMTRHQRVG